MYFLSVHWVKISVSVLCYICDVLPCPDGSVVEGVMVGEDPSYFSVLPSH